MIYPDRRRAELAPAYDLVSTIPYLPEDDLALSFVDSKRFDSLNLKQLERFAAQARLNRTLVLDVACDSVAQFIKLWRGAEDLELPPEVRLAIDNHLTRVPLVREAAS